tara:strand:- start:94 stop:1218 length:1125 start_codon:yes stop_codon:yes gene_type:complete
MSITLREVIPQNYSSDGYGEFSNVDYVLSHPGESMVLGSVRICGDLVITNNDIDLFETANVNLDINIDNLCGAGALFNSIQTSTNAGVLENCNSLPRYSKMKTACEKSLDDLNNGSSLCELKSAHPNFTHTLIRGEIPQTQQTTPIHVAPDFSVKPNICLNSQDGRLPYSRTGDIRLTVNMAQVASCLYGMDMNTTTKYVVKNMNVLYSTYPSRQEDNEPIQLHTLTSVQTSIASSQANVYAQVSAIASSVSCSFIPTEEHNQLIYNSLSLHKVPNLQELQFSMNDSTNKLISFVIRDDQEVISLFLDSFGDTGKNSLSRNNMNNNNAYGVGLRFSDNNGIDLRNQKFNIQLNSNVRNTDPLTMFLYFHGVINV